MKKTLDSIIMISQRMLQTKFKFQTPGGQAQAMAGAHKFRLDLLFKNTCANSNQDWGPCVGKDEGLLPLAWQGLPSPH